MILERRHFDIADKTVFERIKLGHPLRKNAVFEDTACFLYSKQGHSNLTSADEIIHIGAEESVLLSCGTYFNDYLKKDTNHFANTPLDEAFKKFDWQPSQATT